MLEPLNAAEAMAAFLGEAPGGDGGGGARHDSHAAVASTAKINEPDWAPTWQHTASADDAERGQRHGWRVFSVAGYRGGFVG